MTVNTLMIKDAVSYLNDKSINDSDMYLFEYISSFKNLEAAYFDFVNFNGELLLSKYGSGTRSIVGFALINICRFYYLGYQDLYEGYSSFFDYLGHDFLFVFACYTALRVKKQQIKESKSNE